METDVSLEVTLKGIFFYIFAQEMSPTVLGNTDCFVFMTFFILYHSYKNSTVTHIRYMVIQEKYNSGRPQRKT